MNKSTLDLFNREKMNLNKLSKYYFILGIVQNHKRKNSLPGKDPTNAELLMLHEFGSPVQRIPPRPILKYTIDNSQKMIDSCMNKCIEYIWQNRDWSEVELELERTAMRIESLAKTSIYKNEAKLKPNHPYTIFKKGSNIPLLDTGEMVRNIVCILKKRE